MSKMKVKYTEKVKVPKVEVGQLRTDGDIVVVIVKAHFSMVEGDAEFLDVIFYENNDLGGYPIDFYVNSGTLLSAEDIEKAYPNVLNGELTIEGETH